MVYLSGERYCKSDELADDRPFPELIPVQGLSCVFSITGVYLR